MNFSSSRRRLPLVLDLTPLIDVVFLLLIFFMVTTTFVPDSTGMQVDLPRSSSQELIPEGEDLTLELGADGGITLDGQSITLPQLNAELRKAAKSDTDKLVILKADAALGHGRVVEVMDLARELGLTNFAFATEGESDTPKAPVKNALPTWMQNPLKK